VLGVVGQVTSQPLGLAPSQSAHPELQKRVHFFSTHAAPAFVLPQGVQLVASHPAVGSFSAVQRSPHRFVPAGHAVDAVGSALVVELHAAAWSDARQGRKSHGAYRKRKRFIIVSGQRRAPIGIVGLPRYELLCIT